MSIIQQALESISIQDPISFKNLTVFPLCAETTQESDYFTLDEASLEGGLHITEISEGGSVPELKLQNNLQRSVLIIDGEELVGAKQNRILNLTVLAPALSTILVPVSCVEAGRWSYESSDFKPSNRTQFARGRANKAASVSAELNRCETPRSDQSQVWQDISEKSKSMDCHSATGAMSDIYREYENSVDEYVDRIKPIQKQVGALFSINGRVTGFDVFDTPSTLARLLPKLVRSYALDAIEIQRGPRPLPDSLAAHGLIRSASQATTRYFKSVGEGEDFRFASPGIAGGGLVKEQRLIHLVAFNNQRGQSSSGNRSRRYAPFQ